MTDSKLRGETTMDRDTLRRVREYTEFITIASAESAARDQLVQDLHAVIDFAERHMEPPPNKPNYISHDTHVSTDASSYDEICSRCGAVDSELRDKPCPKAERHMEPSAEPTGYYKEEPSR